MNEKQKAQKRPYLRRGDKVAQKAYLTYEQLEEIKKTAKAHGLPFGEMLWVCYQFYIGYRHTVANGEIWRCNECGNENLVSNKPKKC